MRKNAVFSILYSRIVPELLGLRPFSTRTHILASSNYRHMQYVAYIYNHIFLCSS